MAVIHFAFGHGTILEKGKEEKVEGPSILPELLNWGGPNLTYYFFFAVRGGGGVRIHLFGTGHR